MLLLGELLSRDEVKSSRGEERNSEYEFIYQCNINSNAG